MSKFTRFILFNIFTYVAYYLIDTLFTKLDWYSNPALGQDIMIMPTQSDVWLIMINILLSSAAAFYLLFRLREGSMPLS